MILDILSLISADSFLIELFGALSIFQSKTKSFSFSFRTVNVFYRLHERAQKKRDSERKISQQK